MSGRHKMPPAGRRKAAADPVQGAEQISPAPETVEAAEPVAEPVETTAPAEPESVVEPESVDADVRTDVDADTESADDEADEMAADDAADDAADEAAEPDEASPSPARSRVSLGIVLAAVALVLALTCGVLRWLTVSQDQSATARDESVQAAKEITGQMLSYETETVEQQLTAARDRMTGEFLGTYTAMTNEVIPAAHAQRIAAFAEVLRAGVVSAKSDRAELVLFVNQSVQVGDNMPQKTPSVARVTMVKVGDEWLMSEYEPVPL
ncbi:hypothetical protein [Mycolicibacterium setense]|uniref:hypothetical protein n=1 Tax=Mycolicibacterium setense TaxID=431269 RepID=UPI0009EF4886|nr:hypothetical protein [Mycolicibacterium setense]